MHRCGSKLALDMVLLRHMHQLPLMEVQVQAMEVRRICSSNDEAHCEQWWHLSPVAATCMLTDFPLVFIHAKGNLSETTDGFEWRGRGNFLAHFRNVLNIFALYSLLALSVL